MNQHTMGWDSKPNRLTSKDKTAAQKQWVLVWCHERCHKAECSQMRQVISLKVKSFSGSVDCIKKNIRFMDWWQTRPAQPYAVLTDWREVKPLLESLQNANTPLSQYPAAVCIVAGKDIVYLRASEWAKSAKACVPIRVVRALDSAEDVEACVAEIFGDIKQQRQPQCAIENPSSPALQDTNHDDDDEVQSQLSKLTDTSTPSTRTKKPLKMVKLKPPKQVCAMSTTGHIDEEDEPTQSQGRTDVDFLPPRNLPLVEFLNKAVSETFVAEQIERMLKEGVPEQYED